MTYHPRNDGVDHINVYSKGATELGRQLSNFAHAPFRHTQDGQFASVEGYWYWLSTGSKHEGLRVMHGYQAKQYGKVLPKVQVDDFNERVKEAIRCKLRQNRNILHALTDSTLPLTHYYWYGTVDNPNIITLERHSWIIEELERIRRLMQENK